MAFIDYYKILGVDKSIPQDEVKAAYKRRTKQFHPDLHPDDPKAKAKFQALNEAYEVIGDPDKRKKYDQYGEHWREADAFGGGGGGGSQYQWAGGGGGSPFDGFDFNGFSAGGGFSSFFQDLFGGMGRKQGGCKGGCRSHSHAGQTADMEANVDIDLYTALLGGDVMIRMGDGTRLKLRVKAETQNGTRVRLRGKGRDLGNGVRSDLIITYRVKLPTGLTERQRQLLMQIKAMG